MILFSTAHFYVHHRLENPAIQNASSTRETSLQIRIPEEELPMSPKIVSKVIRFPALYER